MLDDLFDPFDPLSYIIYEEVTRDEKSDEDDDEFDDDDWDSDDDDY